MAIGIRVSVVRFGGSCRRMAVSFAVGLVAAVAILACQVAPAATVVVGNHYLLPNTPNQTITIQVTGGEQIAGEDFFAQIGDGGAFIGGSNSKPAFTNVNIIGGSIFAGNNNGAFGDPNGTSPPGSNAGHPLIWVDGTTTNTGIVAANGLLATLTIDTTGLNSGTFPLLLTGVASPLGPFNTTLRDINGSSIPLTVSNGLLSLISLPAGDYNRNGVVDAADFVVWRHTLGQSGFGLAADGNLNGMIDLGDYQAWRAQFGATAGSGLGADANSAIPEPTSGMLLLMTILTMCVYRRSALS